MKITVAKGAGFCFGVRRAYKILEDEIAKNPKGGRIFTLGSFVHNPLIIEELRSRGIPPITEEELSGIALSSTKEAPVTVVLRTHGVTKQLVRELDKYVEKDIGFKYVDCTCPCVSKIHRTAEKETAENPEKKLLIIIGDEKHPEVKAIKSYSESETLIAPTLDVLKSLLDEKGDIAQREIICVAQTTQKLTECKLCQNYLLNRFTFLKIYDTICKVTEERQTEAQELAGQVDVMLILGGRESSNTNKLYEISKKIQPNTFFVERISELPLECITPDINLGITAGASTPDSLIEEAIKAMSEKIENFAELFAESEMHLIRKGDTVKGVVIAINDRELKVDVNSNITGIISSSELSDDSSVKTTDFKVGDEVEAVVIKTNDPEGVAELSKKQFDSRANRAKVAEAFEGGEIIEGKITEVVKNAEGVAKGLVLSALSTKFFIPASQTGIAKGGDISVLLGTTQKVKITEKGAFKKRPVASISVVANEEKKAEIEAFWSTLCEGKTFEGTVKSMTDYGVFVNIGPVDGMVHKTELSWKRFRVPSDIVSVGDKLEVYIKDLDADKKRISLGCKKEDENPWKIFTDKCAVGDVVTVKIVNLMTYGAFAEVVPGVDGLIHISQIANKRLGNPAEVLHVGDEVQVKITEIDNDNKKVSLSIRELLEPEIKEEEAAEETVAEEAVAEETAAENTETVAE